MIWLIRKAMCALYPTTESLPGITPERADAFLRRYKAESNFLMWLGLVIGAVVFTITPLITVGIPLPSFLLPRRALDRHANKIAYHPVYLLRQAVFLVKLSAGLCWGSQDEIRGILRLPPYQPDPGTWRTQ